MVIGVIDTGVDANHRRLKNCIIEGVHIRETKDGEFDLYDDFTDERGHGTGICSIIHKHTPNSSLFVVKLSTENEKVSENLLCEALRYLLDTANCTIINISMGVHTNYPSKQLHQLCLQAHNNGIVIIASAYYISEKECYPAHFPTVIAVGTGLVVNSTSFRYLKNSPINVLAKGGFQRVAHLNNNFRFGSGTSLATAHFTGVLATAFDSLAVQSYNDILHWLEANSNEEIISITKHEAQADSMGGITANEKEIIDEILKSQMLPESIQKIALYPYDEKEIESLISFNHLLQKEVTLCIGNAKPVKYNQKIIDSLKDKDIPVTNKNLTDDDLALFDTLVVGYFLDQLLDHNLFYGYQLVKKCISANKNFIIWDTAVFRLVQKIISQQNDTYRGKVFFTHIDGKLISKLYSLSPMPKLKTPVLSVVGTGSKQGKFTTQLVISDILKKVGYNVSFIASEPQGVLFNADFTFPYGYNPTISVNTGEWSRVLSTYMQCVEQAFKPEIFITGGQGGVIPLYPINLGANGAGLKQLSYLMGVYPDILIMTISPHDEIDFILKTLNTIQAFIDCDVIFYSLTPHTYKFNEQGNNQNYMLDENEYHEKCTYFQEQLGKPVINILDDANRYFILDAIQSSFAKTNIELT